MDVKVKEESSFLENERDDLVVKLDNEIEIKEEQFWREGTSSIYDDGENEDFVSINSSSLKKAPDVSNYSPHLFSNEDLGSNVSVSVRHVPECKSARESQKDIYSETPDDGKIVSMTSCFKENCLLQQKNTNGQDINKQNCNSSLSNAYRKEYKCHICCTSFEYWFELEHHNFVHDNKQAKKCEAYDTGFDQLQSLKTKKLNCIKQHKCNICGKKFSVVSTLKRHILIHKGIKPHKCDVCNKGFPDLHHLKTHKLIHEGIKPHKCDVCNKGFIHLHHLKRHKLIHESIKPYKCNICNKEFSCLDPLKTHKLIHEGIKPHKCDICNKAFTRSLTLKTHKLLHEAIKPHKCDICNKAFSYLQSLKKHKLIHEGINLNTFL